MNSQVPIPEQLRTVPRAILEDYVGARIQQFVRVYSTYVNPGAGPQHVEAAYLQTQQTLYAPTNSDGLEGLSLHFRHKCRFYGCLNKECQLCKNNPNKRCALDDAFDECYADNQLLKAKCDAEIQVEVQKIFPGQQLDLQGLEAQVCVIDGDSWSDATPGNLSEIRRLLRSDEGQVLLSSNSSACKNDAEGYIYLQLQDGQARLPELTVTDKCDTFHMDGATCSSFRLMAVAVTRDMYGNPIPRDGIPPAISRKFSVKTQRALNDYRKNEYPHYKDELTKLKFIGNITAQRLRDIRSHLGKDLPFTSVETVEQLKQLMLYADQHRMVEGKLLDLLNMKGKHKAKWEYLREVLSEKVVYDDIQPRCWWADATATQGVLFSCKQGQANLEKPLGILMRSPTAGLQVYTSLDAAATEVVKVWRAAAEHDWHAGGHGKWGVVQERLEIVSTLSSPVSMATVNAMAPSPTVSGQQQQQHSQHTRQHTQTVGGGPASGSMQGPMGTVLGSLQRQSLVGTGSSPGNSGPGSVHGEDQTRSLNRQGTMTSPGIEGGPQNSTAGVGMAGGRRTPQSGFANLSITPPNGNFLESGAGQLGSRSSSHRHGMTSPLQDMSHDQNGVSMMMGSAPSLDTGSALDMPGNHGGEGMSYPQGLKFPTAGPGVYHFGSQGGYGAPDHMPQQHSGPLPSRMTPHHMMVTHQQQQQMMFANNNLQSMQGIQFDGAPPGSAPAIDHAGLAGLVSHKSVGAYVSDAPSPQLIHFDSTRSRESERPSRSSRQHQRRLSADAPGHAHDPGRASLRTARGSGPGALLPVSGDTSLLKRPRSSAPNALTSTDADMYVAHDMPSANQQQFGHSHGGAGGHHHAQPVFEHGSLKLYEPLADSSPLARFLIHSESNGRHLPRGRRSMENLAAPSEPLPHAHLASVFDDNDGDLDAILRGLASPRDGSAAQFMPSLAQPTPQTSQQAQHAQMLRVKQEGGVMSSHSGPLPMVNFNMGRADSGHGGAVSSAPHSFGAQGSAYGSAGLNAMNQRYQNQQQQMHLMQHYSHDHPSAGGMAMFDVSPSVAGLSAAPTSGMRTSISVQLADGMQHALTLEERKSMQQQQYQVKLEQQQQQQWQQQLQPRFSGSYQNQRKQQQNLQAFGSGQVQFEQDTGSGSAAATATAAPGTGTGGNTGETSANTGNTTQRGQQPQNQDGAAVTAAGAIAAFAAQQHQERLPMTMLPEGDSFKSLARVLCHSDSDSFKNLLTPLGFSGHHEPMTHMDNVLEDAFGEMMSQDQNNVA